MLIIDLDHVQTVDQSDKFEGGNLPIDPLSIIGKSASAFAFNSLAVGEFGSFASGVPEILTTAVPGNFSVGFKFSYTSLAVGIPFERL